MMDNSNVHITVSSLINEAERCLEEGGYKVSRDVVGLELPQDHVLLAEDHFGIVSVMVFETASELVSFWINAQDWFVHLLSQKLRKHDPKIWEGYLLLLTPTPASTESRHIIEDIEKDTSFIRKMVASGDDLQILGDIERFMLPLLPIKSVNITLDAESLLENLSQLLTARDVDERVVEVLVRAFKQQDALLESIYHYISQEK